MVASLAGGVLKKAVKTGVVATRIRNGFREVLLVSTKKNRWGLPKGNLISRLGKKRTALEEAYEEAGVLGEIRNGRRVRLERTRWTLDLYPMRVAKQLRRWPEKPSVPGAGCRCINWMNGCAARFGEECPKAGPTARQLA